MSGFTQPASLRMMAMRKLLLVVVLGIATLVAAPLMTAPSAAAEPKAEAWYCWSVYGSEPIPRKEYYGCPFRSIKIKDLYTGKDKRQLNGDCANQLWVRTRHRATPEDAIRRCTERVYRR